MVLMIASVVTSNVLFFKLDNVKLVEDVFG